MLFDWFGTKKGRLSTPRGGARSRRIGPSISEALESRTYLTVATKLVFINQVPIIVDANVGVKLSCKIANSSMTGLAVQLQTATGQPASYPPPTGEETVTLTLTSTTVANPIFSDGNNVETATVGKPPSSPAPSTAYFPNLQVDVPGQYTLTASDAQGLLASTSLEATVPSPSNSIIVVPQPAATIGTLDNIYMQPEDAFGNPFTIPINNVTFGLVTSSGTSRGTFGVGVNPGAYGTTGIGFYGTAAGSPVEISGTVDGMPITSTLPTIEVNPGTASPTKSTVSLAQTTLAAGSTDTVTLQAIDSNGNNLTTSGASVTFQTLAGTGTSNGTFSSTTDNGNGTYTATFTGTTAGSPVHIEAIISGAIVTTTMPTVKVVAGTLSPAQSTIAIAQSTIETGQSDVVTLQARDQYSNPLTTGGATVVFQIQSQSGTSGGTISTAADLGNGSYTATFIGTTVGTPIYINAMLNGSAVGTVLPSVQVIPAAPSADQSVISVAQGEIAAGGYDIVTLQTKDAAGNTLTVGGATVAFNVLTGNGTSSGFIGPVIDNNDGTYTATFTGSTAGTPVRIDATVNGSALTTVLPTITVIAGAIDPANCKISASTNAVIAGQAAVVTLQAKDSAGNNLSIGGASVLFKIQGTGTSVGTLSPVTDNGDGTYSATFSGVTPGTQISITATVDGVAISSAPAYLAVVAGALDAANSTIITSPIALGQSTTIILQDKDSNGNNVTSGVHVVNFNLTGAINEVIAGTYGGNGTYVAKFEANALGNIQIGATIDGASVPAIEATVPPLAVGFVFPTGFYYKPGRQLTVKVFNLDSSLTVVGPFNIQLFLTDSVDGANPMQVVGGGATFKGKLGPNQSRVVSAKLGGFPSGFIPYESEQWIIGSVTTPQYAAESVSTSPVLSPPAIVQFVQHKPIHVHQGELVNIPVVAVNQGLTGPGLVKVFFTDLTLSGTENVYNGQGNGNGVQFKIQPLGPGLSLKIGSGGFNGKVARAVGHLRIVVPAVVATNVLVSAFYSDGIGSTLTAGTICTLDIT